MKTPNTTGLNERSRRDEGREEREEEEREEGKEERGEDEREER